MLKNRGNNLATICLECILCLCIRKIKMQIHSVSKVTGIYNVIGTLRGAVEPGKEIICLANANCTICMCLFLFLL